MFNVDDVIIIDAVEFSNEELVGVRKFIMKLLEAVDCPIAILYFVENQMKVETWGMSDAEDKIFMNWFSKEASKIIQQEVRFD